MFAKSNWKYMANLFLIFANIQYVAKKNQNGHENGPLKIGPKNKKGFFSVLFCHTKT
jgi:hypothetical protein